MSIYDDLKYFRRDELLSPEGLIMEYERKIVPYDVPSLYFLDKFRDFLGIPIRVNMPEHNLLLRGFRSPREQYRIYDRHRYTYHFWCAFDTTPDGMDLWEYFNAAVRFGWKGVYIDVEKNFVHLDRRPGIEWYRKKENGRFRLVTLS